MISKYTTNLTLPSLPPSAKISHGFPSLSSGSLLSVGQICDHNCTAIYTNCSIKIYNNKYVKIQENKPPIISVTQNAPSQPIYNFCSPIPYLAQYSINILRPDSANAKNIPNLKYHIDLYHAALFSTVTSTWNKDIKAGFLE